MTQFNNYSLKLTTRSIVQLEDRLGTNPLNVFATAQGKLPELKAMLIILHQAILPLNHGVTLDNVYDEYDKWLDEGHNIVDLVNLLVEVFREAGFIPKEDEVKN